MVVTMVGPRVAGASQLIEPDVVFVFEKIGQLIKRAGPAIALQ
jgi:hypothetical protein